MIYIFGSEKCEYCQTQKNIVENRFSNWQYIDVLKDKNAMEIALDVNVIGFPTVIVTDEKNKILLQETGVVGADRIFEACYKKSIPIEKKDESRFFSGGLSKILLASYPDLVQDETVDVRLYSGEKLGQAKIKNIRREVIAGNKKITSVQKQKYLERGGRKDYFFVVEIERNF